MSFALLLPLTDYKFLLWQLTLKEIKARYKQSLIGYAWVIFNPLAQLLVYTFVFSIVFRLPVANVPYIIFVYSGLLPWTFLQNSIFQGTQSLVENGSLLKKVDFPREVIIYSVIMAKFIDLGVASILFFFLIIALQTPIALTAPLVFFFLFLQVLLSIGLMLVLSAMNLFYRDIQYIANLLLLLWMYLTPVLYPLALVPEKYLTIYKLNPMVGVMEGYRGALFGTPIDWPLVMYSALICLLAFLGGYAFFKRSEKYFADVV